MPILITIPPTELYDENKKEFINVEKETKLLLEHSLIAISKWESVWHKSFFDPKLEKTPEEINHYITCMNRTPNVDENVFMAIPQSEYKKIEKYLNDPMTATTFRDAPEKKGTKQEVQTSELIYYYMFKLGIPKECEKWHINRLMTLIKIYGIKDQPNKKVSKSEAMARYSAINAKNRARFNSKG